MRWPFAYLKVEKMSDFLKLLASLQNPGDNEPPETILDDLQAAYAADIADKDSKLNETAQNLVKSNNTVTGLREDLYKATMVHGAPQNATAESDSEDDEIERGKKIRIEDLFQKRKNT